MAVPRLPWSSTTHRLAVIAGLAASLTSTPVTAQTEVPASPSEAPKEAAEPPVQVDEEPPATSQETEATAPTPMPETPDSSGPATGPGAQPPGSEDARASDDAVIDMLGEPGGIAEPAPADSLLQPTGQAEPAPADAIGNPQGTLAGDHVLRVPVQIPVPPAPDGIATPTWGRSRRYLDISSDLNDAIARDGTAVLRRVFGGEADTLILRGAASPHLADTSVTLDGVPYGVPFPGRGPAYADLTLLPIAGIESYEVASSPSVENYGGGINLRARRFDGAEGSIYLGQSGQRRFSLVAGSIGDSSYTTLAMEVRQAQGPRTRTTDDRFSLLATAGMDLHRDIDVQLTMHSYRDIWDASGADAHDRASTDGGELLGTGISAAVTWEPSRHTSVRATLAYLDDRFGSYHTDVEQTETRDRDHVSRGALEVSHHLHAPIPIHLGGGFEFSYDDGTAKRFATAKRERLFGTRNLNSDWLEAGVHAHVEAELSHALSVTGSIGVEQLTIRRTEAQLAGAAQTERHTSPVASLGIHWDLGRAVVRMSWARSERTHPDAMLAGIGGDSAEHDHETHHIDLFSDRAELGASGDGKLTHSVGWAWDVATYGSILGGTLLGDEISGNEALVTGVELRLDLLHQPSGWTLAARGGPMWTALPSTEDHASALLNALADGMRENRDVPGVPAYVAHLGILRPAAEGLLGELWFTSYGQAAVDSQSHMVASQQGIDGRLGYRAGAVALWLGVDNLLDDRTADLWVPAQRVLPRQPRTFYALLDVTP